MKIFITNNSGETQKLGQEFVKRILLEQGVSLPKKSTRVVALYGDLGSGKTTFVQGLAKGLEIKRRILSPTFITVRSYFLKSQKSTHSTSSGLMLSEVEASKIKTQKHNSKLKSLELRSFYHIDLYRIDDKKSTEGLGIEEIINDPQNIVAIEWAEKIGNLLPRKRWDVRFEYVGENKRRVTIEKFKARNPKSEAISKFK